jgi:hypothetical protein
MGCRPSRWVEASGEDGIGTVTVTAVAGRVNLVTQELQAVSRAAFEPAGSLRAAGNEDR